MSDKIYDAIMEVVKSGTFTTDALRQMQEALDQVKSMENRLIDLANLNESLNITNTKSNAEIAEFKKNAAAIKAREDAVLSREIKANALEKDTAVANAVTATWKEVFQIIFKNTVVRKNISGSVPVQSGGSTMFTSGSETEERD